MSFRSASEISRDVYGAYWNVIAKAEENPECTHHMLEGISQILDQIYWLPIDMDMDEVTILVEVTQESVYGRLQRIHRWIVQWPQRPRIDEALEMFEVIFWTNYNWLHRLQGPRLQTALDEYLRNGEDLWDYDEGDTDSGSDSDNSSVETPPLPDQPVSRRNNS